MTKTVIPLKIVKIFLRGFGGAFNHEWTRIYTNGMGVEIQRKDAGPVAKVQKEWML